MGSSRDGSVRISICAHSAYPGKPRLIVDGLFEITSPDFHGFRESSDIRWRKDELAARMQLSGAGADTFGATMHLQFNEVEAVFHHLGIPTTEPKPGERFSARFGMYTSDGKCENVRIQWHRFEPASSLHPLIRTVPHPAFRVADLSRAIRGFPLLLEPYEPIPGFRAAIIEDGGFPIELIETTLTDEELWSRRK